MSTLLKEILKYNDKFVEEQKYVPYLTSKFPERKLVLITCMDTRLIELLPASMNLKNGDVKIIKTAGAVVSHPFGSVMRSILVAIYELNAEEVFVVGHYDCGMGSVNPRAMKEKFIKQGIKEETINTLEYSGMDLERWLQGFDCVADSVKNSVSMIRHHPLLPNKVPVHGLVMDPSTGRLDVIDDGYTHI
ncbi:beta-class carbonic anhydrase [Brevibacillus ginsengisoli]|uniref:beta-class carbonic anhydrase n=1 Tax=Brevibacillus ginsengisoli TaxID=363854 RepID=UPI003CEB5F71